MRFYRFFIVSLLLISALGVKPLKAQQSLQWFKTFGSTQADLGTAIISDKSGNVYVTGTFGGIMQMGIQTLSCKGFLIDPNSDDADGFIARLDTGGNVQWATSFGSNTTDNAVKIVFANDGNLLLTGTFSDTCTFGGTIQKIPAGSTDVFVAKIDAQTGNFIWVQTAGGQYNYAQAKAIAQDASGDILLAGNTQRTCHFGADSITPNGSIDFFVAKYSTNGNIKWVKDFGGTDVDDIDDITTDVNNNIFICGVFSTKIGFGSDTLTSAGSLDIYWSELDKDGNALWAQRAGGPNADRAYGIRVVPNGSYYLTGWTPDTISLQNQKINGNGIGTLFLSRFNSSNQIQWVQYGYNQTFSDVLNDLEVDDKGNAFICGLSNFFVARLEEPGARVEASAAACPFGDLIVCKYDSAGNFLFMNHTLGNNLDMGYGVATDTNRNYYVTGYFTDSISYGPSWHVGNGGSDVLVLKFKDNSIITGNQTHQPDVFETSLYPNPVSDYAFVNLQTSTNQSISMSVMDLSGRVLHRYLPFPVYTGKALIPISVNLPAGFYLLNITGQSHNAVMKFVVR